MLLIAVVSPATVAMLLVGVISPATVATLVRLDPLAKVDISDVPLVLVTAEVIAP